MQYPWTFTQSNPRLISRALSSVLTELPFDPEDGPSSHGKQRYPQRFDTDLGREYVLPFIDVTAYNEGQFTLAEKATLMEFISQSTLNLLADLKIQSDDLVHLLNTLIVRKDVTILQRLSGMTDSNHQDRFNHLLSVVEVHQSNIAAVEDLLKSHEDINMWRITFLNTPMFEVLSAFHKTLSSLSESSATLWREFYWILNL